MPEGKCRYFVKITVMVLEYNEYMDEGYYHKEELY